MKTIIANSTVETLLEIQLLILIYMVKKNEFSNGVENVTILPGTDNNILITT